MPRSQLKLKCVRMRSWRSHVKENSTATIYENASSISTACCQSDFVRPRRLGTYFTNISLVHYNRKMTAKTVAVESRIDTCRSAGPAGAVRRSSYLAFTRPPESTRSMGVGACMQASSPAKCCGWRRLAGRGKENSFLLRSMAQRQ